MDFYDEVWNEGIEYTIFYKDLLLTKSKYVTIEIEEITPTTSKSNNEIYQIKGKNRNELEEIQLPSNQEITFSISRTMLTKATRKYLQSNPKITKEQLRNNKYLITIKAKNERYAEVRMIHFLQ